MMFWRQKNTNMVEASKWQCRCRYLVLLLAVGFACGEAEGPDGDGTLRMVSSFPDDTTDNPREIIRVTFDHPVIPESAVGREVNADTLRISPDLKVHLAFADRQTLVARPLANMSPATRYTVTIVGAPAERLRRENRTFSFVHGPLAFIGLADIDVTMADVNPKFTLRFSQPVSASEVVRRCRIQEKTTLESVLLVAEPKKQTNSRILVRPAHQLRQGTSYAVICQELTAVDGNEPMANAMEEPFSTYPLLSVLEAHPKESEIPPDRTRLRLVFSTPVSRKTFDRHVVVTAAKKRVSTAHFERSASGLSFSWNSYLEAKTDYRVVVKKGLTDQFAQTLDRDVALRFTTTDAPADISVESGVYTVESGGPGYSLWTRNVNRMSVECARIPASRIAAVLTGSAVNFYPWIRSSDTGIDWKQLKLNPMVTQHRIEAERNRWHSTTLNLAEQCAEGAGGGLFLSEFRSAEVQKEREARGWGQYPFRLLANVTDLGVVLKVGAVSGLIWVSRMSTGEIVPGAKVTVYDAGGQRVFQGTTREDGTLSLPSVQKLQHKSTVPSDESDDSNYWSAPRFIATVEFRDEIAVVDGHWNDGISIWNFRLPVDRNPQPRRIRGFIQSDRGIYRPGETIHFKGLVREVALAGLPAVPRRQPVQVTVEDTIGTTLYDEAHTLSRFGGFHFSLPLSKGARLGDYHVHARVAGQSFRERFVVEAFRPVTFEIRDRREPGPMLIGDTHTFAFETQYLFGQPVRDAQAEWSVQRRRRFVTFSQYPGYLFTDDHSAYWDFYHDDDYGYDYGTTFVADGSMRTDAEGMIHFSVTDPEERQEYPQDYIARLSVTDETDQTVSRSVSVTAHPTDYYFGVKTDSWVVKAGDPIEVQVVALSPQGEAVSKRGKLLLIRERWDCSGTRFEYGSSCERKLETVETRNVQVDRGGSSFSLRPEVAGDYRIQMTGNDSRKKTVSASTSVWVTGRDAAWVDRDDTARMTVVLSSDIYAENDVATLIPRYDTSRSTLLVSIERSGVLESIVRDGVPFGEGIDIRVKPEWAPNVVVSIIAVTGRSGEGDERRPLMRMGAVNLKVSTEKRNLDVRIVTDREDYRPGDTVKGRVVVTADGKPVVSEVALSVADEGVLQLINYRTPNPMNAFYKPFGLGVDTAASWLRIARMRPPVEEGVDGADAAGPIGDRVRSRFVSSAYFAPALVTNAKGEAIFSFEAPDNLTAFRLMAAVADAGSRFGASDARIRVNREVTAQPALPRFFSVGDTAKTGAVIHNNSSATGTATVQMTASGLNVSPAHTEMPVDPHKSVAARFGVTVLDRPEATISLRVTLSGHTDAFEVVIPIRQNQVTDNHLLAEGLLEQPLSLPIRWPDSIRGDDSRLLITVDRYGLGSLTPALRYLVTYPYGCMEQIMSQLLPLLKVRDLARHLDLPGIRGDQLDAFVEGGLARVLQHQNNDGHFALWPGGESKPHLTAYALYGMAEATAAGVPIDITAAQRAVRALSEWATGRHDMTHRGTLAELAMVSWMLAYHGSLDAGLNARLFEARAALPVYGRAFLLRALLSAKHPAAQMNLLATEILQSVATDARGAFIEEAQGLSWYMSSSVRTTAIVISALLEYDASHPTVALLIEGLKSRRDASGRWSNTQENAYGLIAVSDVIRRQAREDGALRVMYGDQVLHDETVKGSGVVQLSLPLSTLRPDLLRMESPASLHYNVVLSLVTDAQETTAPLDRGISLRRDYLNPATGMPLRQMKIGDLVKVRLALKLSKDLDYVALVDPFPAGLEAINTGFATENSSLAHHTEAFGDWNHVELRDDRVQAFQNRMPAGEWTLEYLLRATTEGTFSAAPAYVEQMYEPAIGGRTAGISVTISR